MWQHKIVFAYILSLPVNPGVYSAWHSLKKKRGTAATLDLRSSASSFLSLEEVLAIGDTVRSTPP